MSFTITLALPTYRRFFQFYNAILNTFSTHLGGPLGEYVQWTDVIATLFILGHDIKVVMSEAELKRYVVILLVAYQVLSTCTTRQGSRVSCLAQAGFATFGKGGKQPITGVPQCRKQTTFPNNLASLSSMSGASFSIFSCWLLPFPTPYLDGVM